VKEDKSLKVLLHEMTWPEAKEYFFKNDIVILPVGSNEQHGPANPLGTDHLIAKSIAEETAKRTGALCLQVIPFGVSSHHKQFWGIACQFTNSSTYPFTCGAKGFYF
jgi:creatinine amidohydrolase/Fe(II)-dependent formamide hydrolase-like protein